MLKFWMAVPAFLGMMILAGGPCLAAEETTGTAGRKHAPVEIDPSLAKDAVQALRIGTQWLEQQQQPAGCWSQPVFPAMTALAVSAILSTPDVRLNPGKPLPESVKKGLAFIAGNVQPDGGIYQPIKGVKGGGLPNYNTALSIMALAASNDSTYTQIIEKGRQWLIGSQYLGPGAFHGGMGYDAANQRAYADLSNTILALEALKKTAPAEKAGQKDLNWQAAIDFVSNCQHLRETNKAPWVRNIPDEQGGFVYNPEKSNAGEAESQDGQGKYPRSYGSMTYAGLLSFIYADVNKTDPRVQSAFEWIQRHWTLDENPRMGQEGLYYHFHTLAKALDVYGVEVLTMPDGRKVNWRNEFIKKIVSLQKIDPKTGLGYWQNPNNRWFENDPVLVTAYTMKALSIAMLGEK